MNLLLSNLPEEVEAALESRARRTGQTVEEAAISFLKAAVAVNQEVPSLAEQTRRDDFRRRMEEAAEGWVDEPAFHEAIADLRRLTADRTE